MSRVLSYKVKKEKKEVSGMPPQICCLSWLCPMSLFFYTVSLSSVSEIFFTATSKILHSIGEKSKRSIKVHRSNYSNNLIAKSKVASSCVSEKYLRIFLSYQSSLLRKAYEKNPIQPNFIHCQNPSSPSTQSEHQTP